MTSPVEDFRMGKRGTTRPAWALAGQHGAPSRRPDDEGPSRRPSAPARGTESLTPTQGGA